MGKRDRSGAEFRVKCTRLWPTSFLVARPAMQSAMLFASLQSASQALWSQAAISSAASKFSLKVACSSMDLLTCVWFSSTHALQGWLSSLRAPLQRASCTSKYTWLALSTLLPPNCNSRKAFRKSPSATCTAALILSMGDLGCNVCKEHLSSSLVRRFTQTVRSPKTDFKGAVRSFASMTTSYLRTNLAASVSRCSPPWSTSKLLTPIKFFWSLPPYLLSIVSKSRWRTLKSFEMWPRS